MGSNLLSSIATLCTLALTSVAMSPAQSQSNDTMPYVYSTYVFPPNRYAVARHTLRLAIPSNSPSISALKLTAPAGFTLNRQVEVFNNKTGERLPVNINVNRQTIELSFDRVVESGTAINVEINNVRVWGLERHYDLAVKFVSNNRNTSGGKLQVANDRFVNIGRTGLRFS